MANIILITFQSTKKIYITRLIFRARLAFKDHNDPIFAVIRLGMRRVPRYK